MSLMTIPWTLSKRLWARARARGEPSYFIVFSKNARCSSVRGCTYLTIGTSSWGVQSKAKVYIVLDMGRYYTKKLLGGRLLLHFSIMLHGAAQARGTRPINTACVERLNLTIRQHVAAV